MRILHIDETFHPAYGYQSNPLAKFQQKQGNEVYIAAPVKEFLYPVYKDFGDDGSRLYEQDCIYEEKTGVKILRVPAKGYFLRRLVYGNEIFDVIEQVKPDVLFVHCVETITAMRLVMRNKKYPLVLDSHMLSMASSSKVASLYEFFYKSIITKKIIKKKYDVIRTQDDRYVNEHLGIPEEQTPFISFGTDTVMFCPDNDIKTTFRRENGIEENSFVVVYTGKLTESKGGKLLAEAFKKKFSRPVTLVCVGTPPDNDYGREVKKILDESENTVIMFPTQDYMDLAKFYQMADLSVFPKQCSMSFYDAQSAGLPVLSEDNNINVDRCSHENGFCFKSGNVDDFRAKIEMIYSLPEEDLKKLSENARAFILAGYDYTDIALRYTEYLKKAIDNSH